MITIDFNGSTRSNTNGIIVWILGFIGKLQHGSKFLQKEFHVSRNMLDASGGLGPVFAVVTVFIMSTVCIINDKYAMSNYTLTERWHKRGGSL
jgi:hypothetical protein